MNHKNHHQIQEMKNKRLIMRNLRIMKMNTQKLRKKILKYNNQKHKSKQNSRLINNYKKKSKTRKQKSMKNIKSKNNNKQSSKTIKQIY